MNYDPFADDEAQQQAPAQEQAAPRESVWQEPSANQAPAQAQAPVAVAQQDGKVVVTLKGGTGYDAPWIVIHASSVEDASTQVYDPKIPELIERTNRVAAKFSGGSQKPSGGQAAPATNARQGQPQGSQEHPEGKREYCEHGEMKYRAGIAGPNAKNPGAPYQMFVCPNPDRNSQCRPKRA